MNLKLKIWIVYIAYSPQHAPMHLWIGRPVATELLTKVPCLRPQVEDVKSSVEDLVFIDEAGYLTSCGSLAPLTSSFSQEF